MIAEGEANGGLTEMRQLTDLEYLSFTAWNNINQNTNNLSNLKPLENVDGSEIMTLNP